MMIRDPRLILAFASSFKDMINFKRQGNMHETDHQTFVQLPCPYTCSAHHVALRCISIIIRIYLEWTILLHANKIIYTRFLRCLLLRTWKSFSQVTNIVVKWVLGKICDFIQRLGNREVTIFTFASNYRYVHASQRS